MTPTITFSPILATRAFDQLRIRTFGFLAVDMVQKANSGHPGLPAGSVAMSYTFWHRSLKFNPRHPLWPDCDRVVVSAGQSMREHSRLRSAQFGGCKSLVAAKKGRA
jgi:transketolase